MPRRYSRWRTGLDEFSKIRVLDEDGLVVCYVDDPEYAVEIVRSHNAIDPIKTREDWLHAKAS